MTSSSPAGSPTPDLIPSLRDVLRYFSGAMQLMAGRPEGLRRLDLSADGFWSSFSAILVALPPVALSWIGFERIAEASDLVPSSPVLVYGAHALADLLARLLPAMILMAVARPFGFSRKIVPLIVATNWGGALIDWLATPYWLLLLVNGVDGAGAAMGLVLSAIVIGLTVRLTATAIGRDLPAAIAVVLLMILSALVASAAVMDVTGVRLL